MSASVLEKVRKIVAEHLGVEDAQVTEEAAFVDDLVGLVIGPLFVVDEAVFALGLRRDLHAAIEQRAGPVRQRAPAGRGAARS